MSFLKSHRLKNVLSKINDLMLSNQTTYLFVIACIVGMLGGFGAVGFYYLTSFIQKIVLGHGVSTLIPLAGISWYWKIIIPVGGACIVGPLIYFFAREAKGHGVPEVMEAIALKNGIIRPIVVIIKYFASAITIGTGGSVGREGPIVQIGSAIGSTVGQWLKLSSDRLKILVGCGAAAGIAATFNAPIAGAFFSLEVILGEFALTSFGPIIMSSVIATVVSRSILGNYAAFIVPQYELVSSWEIIFYIILGVFAGFVAFAFIKIIYKSEDLFDDLKIPEYTKNILGAVLLGFILIIFPQTYGGGYETITAAIESNIVWYILIFLVFAKLIATSLTLGSGGSGGIFAPSLFLGAVSGGAFGEFIHGVFPDITARSGAYAMVGMGAVVAGATHAPITSILILFELTNDYKIILALMLSCTISTVIARVLKEDSIYTLKLKRKGIGLNHGREEIIMKSFSVGDVMKTNAPVIKETTTLDDIIKIFIENKEPYYYVIDARKQFQGYLSTHELKSVLHEENLNDLVIAKDLIYHNKKFVTLKNNLAQCMDIFSKVEYEHLPVLENTESIKLVGSISRADIIDLYNREILRKDVLGLKFVREFGEKKSRSHVTLPHEYLVDYIALPDIFIGKTIGELDIRAKDGVNIIAIKKKMGKVTEISEIPSPRTSFEEGDILIVIGKEQDLEKFKNKYA